MNEWTHAPTSDADLQSGLRTWAHSCAARGVRALLWDVDGTVAETERDGHRIAFNEAFAAAGVPWQWSVERYGELLAVTGGRERILQDMQVQPVAPASQPDREALALRLHRDKNQRYARRVEEGCVVPRPGVRELVDAAIGAGLINAVVTTTSRDNVQALFSSIWGSRWAERFAVSICGEDVQRKKPDPEAYRLALHTLGLAPVQAIALEDSPNGLHAAREAGIACVVTRSVYFRDAQFDGAQAVFDDLGQVAQAQAQR